MALGSIFTSPPADPQATGDEMQERRFTPYSWEFLRCQRFPAEYVSTRLASLTIMADTRQTLAFPPSSALSPWLAVPLPMAICHAVPSHSAVSRAMASLLRCRQVDRPQGVQHLAGAADDRYLQPWHSQISPCHAFTGG